MIKRTSSTSTLHSSTRQTREFKEQEYGRDSFTRMKFLCCVEPRTCPQVLRAWPQALALFHNAFFASSAQHSGPKAWRGREGGVAVNVDHHRV